MSNEVEELKDELRKNREQLKKQQTRRRSILNPMFWIGMGFYLMGFLLCLTIIGLPLGVAMISGGRSWMYKNTGTL